MKAIFRSRRHHYMAGLSIFLVAVTLMAGLAGCSSRPTVNAIEVRDWYDLSAIGNNLSADYILMNDLDRNTPGYTELASATANGGKGWQPIGIGEYPYFVGLFDGQGYEIRDLFIDRPEEHRVGLFSQITWFAVIRNVGVVNATVTGSSYVGGLVGYNWKNVINCYFSGNVIGSDCVGGLVGGNAHLGTVSNCYATGIVTGDKDAGGLVGGNAHLGTVSNCYATGIVTGDKDAGGLVGYNAGTVSDSYSTGNVTGDEAAGGLVGGNWGTVSDSYSSGSMTGNLHVGGLAL